MRRTTMEIHFCDICGESIPDSDLTVGRAVRVGDRIVCRRCDEAMTRHVAPAAAQSAEFAAVQGLGLGAPRGATHAAGGGTVWLVASCVGAMALLGYLSVERVKDAERRVAVDVAAQVASVEHRIGTMERRIADLLGPAPFEVAPDPRIDTVLAEIRALRASGADTSAVEMLLSDWSEQLAALTAADRSATSTAAAANERLDRFGADLAVMRDDLRLLARSMLDYLEEAPAAAPPPADLRREVAAGQPAWLAFVGGLSSKDDSERWNSIEELGASSDPEAATYVVPMLADGELFVRMAAARVLGTLGNQIAIPALIDALEDVEPSVREAAVMSLRTLSGRSFRFDPNGDPKDRAKRIQAWRDWWNGEGAAAAGG